MRNRASRRTFAIVPAAGVSRRMGRPKLLLPWKGRPLIDFVLRAWTRSSVDRVVVVVRKSDRALQAACRNWPVELVCPERDPPDMKSSLEHGLRYAETWYSPTANDGWIVAPADVPRLSEELIDTVVAQYRGVRAIAACYGGRRGHPVLLPWTASASLYSLRDEQGLSSILEQADLDLVDFPAQLRPTDVDTPDDYRRMTT